MAKLQLTANEYGFDINIDNPFVVFRYLNQIAVKKVGVEKVLDMSRGDPGYGFAPNVRSRRFMFSRHARHDLNNTHFKDCTAITRRKHLQISNVAEELPGARKNSSRTSTNCSESCYRSEEAKLHVTPFNVLLSFSNTRQFPVAATTIRTAS
jgi:hypothetical protein